MGLVFRHRVPTFTISEEFLIDDTDLFTAVILPAGREIEVRSLKAHVRTAGDTADSWIELVKDDGSDTVICKVAIDATGYISAYLSDGTTAATFPIRVPFISATATKGLKLKVGGSSLGPVDLTVEVHISEPGV